MYIFFQTQGKKLKICNIYELVFDITTEKVDLKLI